MKGGARPRQARHGSAASRIVSTAHASPMDTGWATVTAGSPTVPGTCAAAEAITHFDSSLEPRGWTEWTALSKLRIRRTRERTGATTRRRRATTARSAARVSRVTVTATGDPEGSSGAAGDAARFRE